MQTYSVALSLFYEATREACEEAVRKMSATYAHAVREAELYAHAHSLRFVAVQPSTECFIERAVKNSRATTFTVAVKCTLYG